jgi:uncharacterized Fe-S cluster-containing radical SAM superfamily protein
LLVISFNNENIKGRRRKKMDYRKTKLYKTIDSYTACSIAEGFCEGENASEKDILTAWQWLSDTGTCWHLQGFYGRTVTDLLKRKLIQLPIKTHKDYYGNIVQGTK